MENRYSYGTLVLWICCTLCLLFSPAASQTDCRDLNFWGYNAISWQSTDGGALSVAARNLYRDGYGFNSSEVVVNYSDAAQNNHNLLSVLDYLAMFQGCVAGGVYTHGGWDGICVQFFSSGPYGHQAALALGFTLEQSGVDYGVAPVTNGSGATIGYSLAVSNDWANDHMYWDVDSAVFFNIACYGVCNNYAYSGELSSAKFCIVGPQSSIYMTTAQSNFTTLFHNMDCSYSNQIDDTIYEALTNTNMLGAALDYAGNPNLGPSPCSSCNNDVPDEDIFVTAGMQNTSIYWYLRHATDVDEYRIYGTTDAVSTVLATQPASAYQDSVWFDLRSYEAGAWDYDSFYIEAFKGPVLVGRSYPFVREGFTPAAAAIAESVLASAHADVKTAQSKSSGSPDVVIVAQYLGSTGLDISNLVSFYADQGMNVATVTDYSYMEFNYIRSEYANQFDAAKSPLLVLCGPAPVELVDPRYPLSVPQGHFPDACSGCGMGGTDPQCYGDWDYTDVDLDGIPDGPITRIPVVNQASLDAWVSRAEDFNAGVGVDARRHIALVSGDWSNSQFNSEMQGIGAVYDAMDYSPLLLLRESDYPTTYFDEDAWNDFGSQLNAGVLEMWVAGSATGPQRWTSVLRYNSTHSSSWFSTWSASLERTQGVIVWAATCNTTYRRIHNMGYEETSLAYDFLSSPTSHAVAVVGHNMAGWGSHHKLMRSYLLEQRQVAVPGETSVANIAWQAVKNMIQDYPYLASHAKSLGVWGCDVKVQQPALSGVAESTSNAHAVTLLSREMGGPGVRVGGAAGEPVAIAVYDVRGRLVSHLHDGVQANGHADYPWNGRDANGRIVASGLYLFRVNVGDDVVVHKVIVDR